jgi:hypothetical protein
MKKNQKVLLVNQPSSETLIDLLLAAGFENTEEISDRIVRASISPEAFSEAHAAFLQAAGNHPALIGCSRFDAYPAPVLIVHRREVETVENVKAIEAEAPPAELPPEE